MNRISVPSEDRASLPPVRSVTAGDVSYRLEHQIGIGAFSKVYKGVDGWGNRIVAKVLSPDAPPRLWENELKALHRFRHPRVVPLLSSFGHGGHHFLVMEDAGICLARLDFAEALRPFAMMAVANGLLQALQFIHEGGFIHGDVSPNNILAHYPEPRDLSRLCLADFAFCRPVRSLDKGPQMFSPWQPAPENLDPPRFGRFGTATDVYLAALVLLQVASGVKRHFTDEEALRGEPRALALALPYVDGALGAALAEGLDPVAGNRPTPLALWQALRRALPRSVRPSP